MWQTIKQFYNSKQWNSVRKAVIAERSSKTNGNIVCEYCGKVISTFEDAEVDHIKELTRENINDVSISLNADNLKIACHECHNKKHGRFTAQNKKVYIVYGAPFSGKNTYVKEHMTRGDIVLSFDKLFEAVSFLPQYEKPSLLSYNVFALRNHLFDQIKTRYGKFKTAWVIGGYANKHDRENEKRSKFDNIKLQNAIEQTLLDGIYINDMWFDIEQIHTDNTEGVLCCSFDLEMIEEIERKQTNEYMEELKTNII